MHEPAQKAQRSTKRWFDLDFVTLRWGAARELYHSSNEDITMYGV